MIRAVAFFATLIFFSGFFLISTRYHARDLYVHIETLRNQAHELDVQWRRLQLERAELTRNARIDEIAREVFNMAPAGPERTIYLPGKRLASSPPQQGGQP